MFESSVKPGLILAIETSGRLGSVAVGEGADVLCAAQFSADLRHAVELMPTIKRLCNEVGRAPTDVLYCFVSGGPGSFTGVRIGITVARALAFAGGVRIVRVPTLDVVAQNALTLDEPPPGVGVILDAKRKKVYAAPFKLTGNRYERAADPAERDPAEFACELPEGSALMGDGIPYVREALGATNVPILDPSTWRARAEIVLHLGHECATADRFDDPRTLIPIYVRRPEAEELWDTRRGTS